MAFQLFRIPFVVALLVLSCGGTTATVDETVETGSLFLRKAKDAGMDDHDRILRGGRDECRPGEIMYYNAFFTLTDEEGTVTEQCEPEDEEEMGRAIRNIVADVDEDFPKWEGSLNSIATTVCIFPTFSLDDAELVSDTGRNLAELTPEEIKKKKRRRRRYLFSSGGRCRRCATNRFLLGTTATNFNNWRILGKDDKNEKENKDKGGDGNAEVFAIQACEMASISNAAMSKGHKARTNLEQYVADIDSRMDDLEDSKKVMKKIEYEDEMLRDIVTDIVKLVKRAIDDDEEATEACDEAQEYAIKGDAKRAEKSLKTAESASEKVQEYLGEIHVEYELARDYAKTILEVLIDQKHKEIRDMNKEQVNQEKDSLNQRNKAQTEVLNEIKDELKDDLKDNAIEEEEAERIKAELLKREWELKEEIERARDELNEWEDEIKDEGQYLHVLDEYRLAMQFAESAEGT